MLGFVMVSCDWHVESCDLGGRLLGERFAVSRTGNQYVGCGEAQTSATDAPISDVPGGSVGESLLAASAMVDVRYEYDLLPTWLPSGTSPLGTLGGYLLPADLRSHAPIILSS